MMSVAPASAASLAARSTARYEVSEPSVPTTIVWYPPTFPHLHRGQLLVTIAATPVPGLPWRRDDQDTVTALSRSAETGLPCHEHRLRAVGGVQLGQDRRHQV